MIRTQIYLTDEQRAKLAVIAKNIGKKQSELIREAIDRLIDQTGQNQKKTTLREAAGIWKDRDDLPDFRAIRSEWDAENGDGDEIMRFFVTGCMTWIFSHQDHPA
jgi:hypothetical protein